MKKSGVKYLLLILGGLAVGQVIWWGYAIVDKERTISLLLKTQASYENFQKVKTMILSEGLVFIAVWILGMYFAFRYYKRELELQKTQNHFLAAVTHELKTPITNIQLCLETLERPNLDKEMNHRYISRAKDATQKLNSRIEQILRTTTDQNIQFTKKPVELKKIAQNSLDRLNYEDQNKYVKIDVLDNLLVETSAPEAEIIVQSILDNAIKYSKKSKNILVSARTSSGNVILTISDEGIGMSSDDARRAVQPFWRGEFALSEAIPGTGLGLSLSKSLCTQLGIELELQPRTDTQGTLVELTFEKGRSNG